MSNDLSRRDAVKLAGSALTSAGLAGIAEGAPATAAMPADSLSVPDFRGKVVVLYCRGRTLKYPVVLSDCCFEVQVGRVFLLGKDQPRGRFHGWTDGLRRGVAWESVEEYLVFESLEEYLARLQSPDEGVPF
jgi:hypothetical protein